jgi:hypothetical protein
LELNAAGESAVGFHAKISASLFPATVQVTVRGILRAGEADDLRVTDVALEVGSGLFAGMARALIEPHIRQWTDSPFPLRPLTGFPAHWKHFAHKNGAIEGCLRFDAGKTLNPEG